MIASHAFFATAILRSACCSRKASMSSWFSAAAETPTEASPAAALDEAALLLKSFTREEAELGARAPLPRLDGYVFVLFIAAQLALNWALRLIIARPLANFLLATPDLSLIHI